MDYFSGCQLLQVTPHHSFPFLCPFNCFMMVGTSGVYHEKHRLWLPYYLETVSLFMPLLK